MLFNKIQYNNDNDNTNNNHTMFIISRITIVIIIMNANTPCRRALLSGKLDFVIQKAPCCRWKWS